MVWFKDTKPALESSDIRSKLEQVTIEDIFRNLSEEEVKQTKNWYQSLRREEQLNLNGVLTILLETKLERGRWSEPDPDFAIVVTGSSISSSEYSDIDLFLLPRKFSYKTANLIQDSERGKTFRSPFDSTTFIYGGLREVLAQFNCFYGDEECGYGDDRPAAFEDSKFGKELTLFILQELEGKKHDFRERRKEYGDDFIYAPTGAEGLMKFNRQQNSKFLVLFRQYRPLQNEGLSLFECFKRDKCYFYQNGILKPEVQKYMCDGMGRDVPEKVMAKDAPTCPLSLKD